MRLKQPRIETYAENMTFIFLNLVQGTLFKLKYGLHARLLSENVCAYNKADSNSVFHVQMAFPRSRKNTCFESLL